MLQRKKQEQAGEAVKTRTSLFLFGYCKKNVENSASIPAAFVHYMDREKAESRSIIQAINYRETDIKLKGKKKGVSLKVSVFPFASQSLCKLTLLCFL